MMMQMRMQRFLGVCVFAVLKFLTVGAYGESGMTWPEHRDCFDEKQIFDPHYKMKLSQQNNPEAEEVYYFRRAERTTTVASDGIDSTVSSFSMSGPDVYFPTVPQRNELLEFTFACDDYDWYLSRKFTARDPSLPYGQWLDLWQHSEFDSWYGSDCVVPIIGTIQNSHETSADFFSNAGGSAFAFLQRYFINMPWNHEYGF